jgi:hypothetical protein
MTRLLINCFVMLFATAVFASGCDDDGGQEPTSASSGRGDGGARGDRDASDSEERVRVLVGALSDSDVKLGVIATALRARLFFCGGADTVQSMTRWVVADIDQNDTVELDADDWHISGHFDGDELIGALARDGEEDAEFVAKLALVDTLAGVYEGMDQCGRVGLIVTQPSQNDVATAQGACVGMGHSPEAVTALLPIMRENDGSITVQLEDDDAPRLASVIAAAAPE